MMRMLVFLSIVFLYAIPTHAQLVIKLDDYAGFIRDQNLRQTVYDPRKESVMAGSPYLRDTFQTGEVLMRNGVKYTGVPLRYNIFLDELEFKGKDGEIWALSNPESLEFIKLGGDKLVYEPFLINRKMEQAFFLVLVEGKMSLYRKPRMILQDPVKAGAYKDAQPPKFVDRPDEFYLKEERQPARLIFGKKELPELFPDRQKELNAFIKKNKVKTHKPEDLIGLVRYYNELEGIEN